MKQQNPSNIMNSGRILEIIVKTTIGAGAVSGEVFLHRRFGSRYLNTQAAIVLLLIPLYGLLWEGHDLRPLMAYLAAYLVMVIIARIGIIRRYWQRDNEHSYYNGWPVLLSASASNYEYLFKQVIEPLFVFAMGMMLANGTPPLSGYLFFVSFCLIVNSARMNGYAVRQAIDLADAVIEQELRAERFRGLRGY